MLPDWRLGVHLVGRVEAVVSVVTPLQVGADAACPWFTCHTICHHVRSTTRLAVRYLRSTSSSVG